MKEGILAVSFGTSHQETREKNIGAIERELAAAFPPFAVRRAFTSGMILNILRKRDGIQIDNVPQALERMLEEGFRRLVIQPTHVINGEEYDKLRELASPYLGKFDRAVFGAPLLTTTEDYRQVAGAVGERFSPGPREALVLMGHGTAHHANSAYPAMDYVFKELGWKNIFVGTVEGYPEIDTVLRQVQELGCTHVTLAPLMLVAGDHAMNDMQGDEEDSWKNRFAREGFQVTCVAQGLGEIPAIRRLYVAHAAEAIAQLDQDGQENR